MIGWPEEIIKTNDSNTEDTTTVEPPNQSIEIKN